MILGTVLSTNSGDAVATRRSSQDYTGHDKQPVAQVQVSAPPKRAARGGSGVAGDYIGDLAHHGGSTQALYAVSQSELDYWSAQLGRRLAPGSFAENLTVAGFNVDEAPIGQQWQVGKDVVLQVTGARIPCRTFAAAMGEPQWVRRYTQRGRPGAYLGVIAPGTIQAGDTITALRTPGHGLAVRDYFAAAMGERALAQALLETGDLMELESAVMCKKAGPLS